jgi:pentatricopeptide repeat protein
MLSEEGLILLGVFVGCALVVLGALEVIWPTRPRYPERRSRPVPELWRQMAERGVLAQRRASSGVDPGAGERVSAARASGQWTPPRPEEPAVAAVVPRDPAMALPAAAAPKPAAVEPAAPVVVATKAPVAEPAAIPVAAPVSARPETAEPAVVPPAPARPEVVTTAAEPVEPAATVSASDASDDRPLASPPALRVVPPQGEPQEARRERRGPRLRSVPRPASRPAPPEAPVEPAPRQPPEPPAREVPIVERCRALLETRQFAEVVTLGQDALGARKAAAVPVPSPAVAQETAQLWGVVGLAKQGLEDFDGARFAFEEAIAVAPRAERPTWERRLASLALTVGRQSLLGAENEPARPARVSSLRTAIDWLERGLVVAPDDTGLRDALAATREALWPTYEAVVKALVQRQEFDEARRMIDEVVEDPECPPERRSGLRELLDGAQGAEAGQATAEALRLLQRGQHDEAAAVLTRAESMLTALGADGLSAKRRQELERRLWSAYLKLGVDRVEAGAREAAMAPLFRALALTELGSERQDVARAMLTRALGEIVDERSAAIGRLIDAGDLATASTESDKLWSLLRGAVDQGLPEDDVLDVFNKVLALFRRMNGKRA